MFRLGKEKRRAPRVKVHYLLRYKAGASEKVLSFVKDISAVGILFHSKERIPLDAELELEINFHGPDGPVRVNARTVRVKALRGMDGFEVGAEFINIDENARAVIKRNI